MPARAAVGDGGARRGASLVRYSRIFADPKKRATTGRPYKIGVKSVHRDDMQITPKYACLFRPVRLFHVGATTGRPPKNDRIAHAIERFASVTVRES